MKQNHNLYLKLAFEQARINLGSTKANPSVGCVVEKEVKKEIIDLCTAFPIYSVR